MRDVCEWCAQEKEKAREEEQRNYMQLERDKINSFWEITKKELEDKKAELRNKDREKEEMEEQHQTELKVYKQKVKHLLYEHQNNVSSLKADGEKALKEQEDEFKSREGELNKDKRTLKLELREAELAHRDNVEQLKADQQKTIDKLQEQANEKYEELRNTYEKKMKNLREDLELRRKQEVNELTERKNKHINELMRKHEKAFAEIKNYYNDITHNNLDLIKTLKEDIAEMKKKEASNEKLMYEIAQENKRLHEPLDKATKDVESLTKQLANYEKDKQSLKQTKARLRDTEKALKNLEWEHEVYQQRMEKMQEERDDLYNKFEQSVHNVQQKSGLKAMMLERKLGAVESQLERKEAQLGEVLKAANLDEETQEHVTRRLDEVLQQKDELIRSLQYDLDRTAKAHNDMVCCCLVSCAFITCWFSYPLVVPTSSLNDC